MACRAGQHIKVYLLFWRYDEKCVNIEFFQDFVSFASFSVFHFKFASQLEESRFCDVNTPEARKKELDRNSVKNNSPFSQANSFFLLKVKLTFNESFMTLKKEDPHFIVDRWQY